MNYFQEVYGGQLSFYVYYIYSCVENISPSEDFQMTVSIYFIYFVITLLAHHPVVHGVLLQCVLGLGDGEWLSLVPY